MNNIDYNMIIDHLITWVFTVATPVVLYLMHKLISKIADKYHLDNLVNYNGAIDDIVTKAMQSIEVEADHAIRNNGTVLTAEQKIQSVIKLVTDEMSHLQLPSPPPAQLVMRVHSQMFDTLQAAKPKAG